MPHDDFYNFIFKLEDIFIKNFPSIAIEDGVGTKIKDLLCTVRYKHPCEKFNKMYLIKLYTRLKIYKTISFLNKSLMTQRQKKRRKLAILKHL
jgi:hypothetical protein